MDVITRRRFSDTIFELYFKWIDGWLHQLSHTQSIIIGYTQESKRKNILKYEKKSEEIDNWIAKFNLQIHWDKVFKVCVYLVNVCIENCTRILKFLYFVCSKFL